MTNMNLILPDTQPPRADAVKNHALLLETAQRLFHEYGVDAVSMSAIAEAAGVGKGTLYRHFKNKLELAVALLDEEQRDLQTRTLRRLGHQDSACEKLRWFITEVSAFVVRNIGLLAVGLESENLLGHPAHFWWRQTINSLLAQIAEANSEMPANPAYIADVIYIMLDVRTILFQKQQLGYSDAQILEGLKHIIERLTK